MEEVVFGKRCWKEVVHICCFWRGGSPANRRNDEGKRRLEGTGVKNELTGRMKQSGKGKILQLFLLPLKNFSSWRFYVVLITIIFKQKTERCKSFPVSVCLRNDLLNCVSLSSFFVPNLSPFTLTDYPLASTCRSQLCTYSAQLTQDPLNQRRYYKKRFCGSAWGYALM